MAGGFPDLNSAIKAFEEQQQKINEYQRQLNETSTSVDSAKRLLTITMDGHGEISDVKFNTTAYRTMAPAELASIVLETFRKARSKSLNQMQEIMGGEVAPGVDINEVNSGKTDLGDVLGKLLEPSMELIREADSELNNRPKQVRREAQQDDDGWER